jgi:hypothetical protein
MRYNKGMPNWCENILTVSGPTEEVDRFIKDNLGEDSESLAFSKAVPEPTYEGYNGSSHDKTLSGLPTWYHWRIANWGTKWEPDTDLDIERKTNVVDGENFLTATYYFSTAWGPGDVWFEKVVGKYPKLRFSYVYGEPGNNFGGVIVALGGRVTGNIEGETYDFLPEPDWA